MSDSCTPSRDKLQAPIFILGILPRCGTNFLNDLLTLHPDCAPPEPLWEDFLLYHADRLKGYAEAVFASWNPNRGVPPEMRDRMLRHLGDGLARFLRERAGGKRVVAKTPRTDHLNLFFKLFPQACLFILVRDGRSVVESGVRSFGWNRESAIRHWARSAQRIIDFDQAHKSGGHRYRIVRYEDLWTDLENEVRGILEAAQLDPSVYDFATAAGLPLRGSSTLRESGNALHWNPVQKPRDFDPNSRFRHWNNAQRHRFNYLAGEYLKHFGYDLQDPGGNRVIHGLRDRVKDLGWFIVRTLGVPYLRLRGRPYRAP